MALNQIIQLPNNSFKNPTIDAQFKHIRTYGTTELKAAVFVDSYDPAQPDAKAVGNAGASGYIELGANQKSNPVGLYGKDTQYTAANPNRGKLSIKPNIGAANITQETVELMGIGADDTNAIGKAMPTGAWIRCRNDVANPVNAAFSLTNIPEGGAANGKIYSCVVNNTTGANPGDYNMYITDITGGVENNTDIININPTSATAADITLGGPSAATGNVIVNSFKYSGLSAALSGGPPSTVVVIPGPNTLLAASTVIILTATQGTTADLSYAITSTTSFTISCSAASTAKVAWFIARL
jgi:hypothetical protein